MSESDRPPDFDDDGINLADPHDARGRKTDYISTLQCRALREHVGPGSGPALDLGCGFGRMTRFIETLGYDVTGVDPSLRVLRWAKARTHAQQGTRWCVGRMPELPFADGAFPLVFLLNVARPLHLMQRAHFVADAARVVARGGRLVVLDNLREGDGRYLPEAWFREVFADAGLRLVRRVALRSGRNPWILLVRYGLLPRRWFERLAAWELARMARVQRVPRWTYHNVLFVYERA